MKYPYFRGLEADRYSFYRVPKALIKVDLFEKMSGDAKLLYYGLNAVSNNMIMADRKQLKNPNGLILGTRERTASTSRKICSRPWQICSNTMAAKQME